MASMCPSRQSPRLPIVTIDGRRTDLRDFCGQKLVVLFTPAEPCAAQQEIEAFEALLEDYEDDGVWVIAIATADFARAAMSSRHVSIGHDPDGHAFVALAAAAVIPPERREGATFLIGRDGLVRSAWPRCGHARDALAVAAERP
jgi:peroxiredoxin